MIPVRIGREASLALSMTKEDREGEDPLDKVIVLGKHT
jgi:hypothetical protein